MNQKQFEAFVKFRNGLKEYCEKISTEYSAILKPLQISSSQKDTPSYPLENTVVYNTALDEITLDSQIKLIVIGDNPGKDEQLLKNQKYLVGQSGKIAAGFFQKNSDFGVDFRKNAIILNKTPIHTAKTKHLKTLSKSDSRIAELIEQSQIFMAEKTAELHKNLLSFSEKNGEFPELWLVGYAELKNKGIFTEYRESLKKIYSDSSYWDKVFVFQHFSMNRFSIDLKDFREKNPSLSIVEACRELGKIHKKEIFG